LLGSPKRRGLTIVYSVASATNVVQDLAVLYKKEQGVKVTIFFAASMLAKPIGQGAPKNVCLFADLKGMDSLDRKGEVVQASHCNLHGNRVVPIALKGKAFPVKLEKNFDLPDAFQGHWCSRNPSPTGQHSQQDLTALSWWSALEARLTVTPDVRSALAFVERGEGAGVVHETGAKLSDKIKVLGVFPADTPAPVLYPVTLMQGSNPASQGFLDFPPMPAAVEVIPPLRFHHARLT